MQCRTSTLREHKELERRGHEPSRWERKWYSKVRRAEKSVPIVGERKRSLLRLCNGKAYTVHVQHGSYLLFIISMSPIRFAGNIGLSISSLVTLPRLPSLLQSQHRWIRSSTPHPIESMSCIGSVRTNSTISFYGNVNMHVRSQHCGVGVRRATVATSQERS